MKLGKLLLGSLAAFSIAAAQEPERPEEANTAKKADDNVRFEIDAYSENNPYVHTNLDWKIENNFIVGGEITANDDRVISGEGRLITLTPNYYFGIAMGTRQTTDMLLGSSYIKLQLGTRPELNNDFNQRLTLAYINLPSFFSQSDNIPTNILALSYAMQLQHAWALQNDWQLGLGFRETSTIFYNPFPSSQLMQKMAYNNVWKPWMGDLTVLGLSHSYTEVGLMLSKGNFGFGVQEEVDLGILSIAYHLAKMELNYDNLMLSSAFGVRQSDILIWSDQSPYLLSTYPTEELVARTSAVFMPNERLTARGYLEYNLTTPENSILAVSLQQSIGDWAVGPYYYNNGRFGNEIVGVSLSYNFPQDRSHIDPDEYDNRTFESLPEPLRPSLSGGGIADYPNAAAIHAKYGNTLEQAVTKIHNYSDLSSFVGMFAYELQPYSHETAEDIYRTGDSDCKGINGELIPYVIEHSLGYESMGVTVYSPGTQHMIAAAWTNNGTIDIIDYTSVYHTGEKDLQKAIQEVYPGALITTGIDQTETARHLRDLVESPIYEPF